jgi:TolB-like protein/Tfp pilus assembly protein PilF
MILVSELRRRNVFRMAALYAVTAWLIMQAAEVIIGLAHLPDWMGPTILGLLAVGFPIALIFSWFYELTPEGISLEKDVDRSESITHGTGRRLDFIVISLLCAAVILFAYDKWWMRGPPEKSIAVLAFTNMSNDPEQEYFSDGISEELLNVLAKIPGLRVAARTSSFQFKDENRDIVDIGQQLSVTHVLEGSVRKAGLDIRITAQLIDASNGFHLWSETYDRELANIFAVQDEISAAIVNALKEHLGLQVAAAPRVTATTKTEAHEAYLRGRYLVGQRNSVDLTGAVREFEKAITLDPEYALAHAELAMAVRLLSGYDDDLTETESIAKATSHAELAMALDSSLAEAHAATGFVLWKQDGENLEEVLTQFEQAIQINPNYSIVHNWMGGILADDLGRYQEAFIASETAMRLNPLSIPANFNYIRGLIRRNRLDEADRKIEKLASIHPGAAGLARNFRMSSGGKWANFIPGILDGALMGMENPLAWDEAAWYFAVIGLEKEAFAISESPQIELLRISGKPEDAVTIAQARLAEAPESPKARSELGLALASAGYYVRARPILEQMWQRSGGRVAGRLFKIDDAAALIDIRRADGEETKVGELIAAINDDVRRNREAGIIVDYEEGLAAYLAGERERGLALIAKGQEDGYFIPPKLAYLQALYDDPGFAPIRASQEARQRRERDKILDIVCTDNPYAAVWQPEEGTCE